MGDKPSSSVAPRKMKFTPKIPPRKTRKTPAPKSEEAASNAGHVLDSNLLKLVKHAEPGKGRPSMADRRAASMEVTFGQTDQRTSARSFRMISSSSSSSSSSGQENKDDHDDTWDYCSYYPVTLPLRRPYKGNPGQPFSLEAEEVNEEREVNAAKELALTDGEARGRMFFLQLPAAMPIKSKEKARTFDDLPAGFMGKMLIYKSGMVKMKLGDAAFDVSPGSECSFAQDVVSVNVKERRCCALGGVSKRMVVRPDVDSLLETVIQLD